MVKPSLLPHQSGNVSSFTLSHFHFTVMSLVHDSWYDLHGEEKYILGASLEYITKETLGAWKRKTVLLPKSYNIREKKMLSLSMSWSNSIDTVLTLLTTC